MTQHYSQLIQILRNLRRKRIFYSLLGCGADAFVLWLGCVMIVAWVDIRFPIPYGIRMVLRYLLVGGTGVFFLFKWLMPVASFTLKRMSLILQAEMNVQDSVVNALQFEEQMYDPGTSRELKEAFIRKTLETLHSRPSPRTWMKKSFFMPLFRLGIIALIACVMVAVPPYPLRTFFPRMYGVHVADEIYQYFDIFPKDARIPEGQPVTIQIHVKERTPAPFYLFVRGSRTPWEQVVMERVADDTLVYRIEHLDEQMMYFIRMRDLRTKQYILMPQVVPRIIQVRFSYRFPSYTRRSEEVVEDEPFIRALRGTEVTIHVETNIPLAHAQLRFQDGRSYQAEISKRQVRSSFLLDKEGECFFEMKGEQGESNSDPLRIPVSIEHDTDPIITILAPADNLITSPDRAIPITYAAEDDFGLTRIFLVFKRIGARSEMRKYVHHFTEPKKDYIGDYLWQIVTLMLNPGDILEYYLEAEDNDTLSGPKRGRSEIFHIEMISYEKEHERINAELEAFRMDILDSLGDQILAHESLSRVIEGWDDPDKKKVMDNLLKEISFMQDSIENRLQKASQRLEELLPVMELDPLGDVSVYMEHQAMLGNLDHIIATEMEYISKALGGEAFKEASRHQEAVIAELEKMQLLSEDVMKRRKMQDLVNTADSLLSKSEGLLGNLEQFPDKPTEEDIKRLEEALAELSSMMQEISKYLNEIPQDLPEDFVNQEAVKSLNLHKMQEISERISAALSAGDIEMALQLARALTEQVRSMLNTLKNAADSTLQAMGESGGMRSVLEKSIQELEQIIVEQENLLGSTRQYEELRQERFFKHQENLLEKLARKQEKLLRDTEEVEKDVQSFNAVTNQLLIRSSSLFSRAKKNMEHVLKEFKEKRVFKSQEYLEDIIRHVQSIENLTESQLTGTQQALANLRKAKHSKKERKLIEETIDFYKQLEKDLVSIIEGEKEILNKLRESPSSREIFKPSEMKGLKGLAQAQGKLKGRTKMLSEQLQEFSRQTALLGPETFEQFFAASGHMGRASDELSDFQSHRAVESEKKALENLLNGKKSLSQSMEALRKMLTGAGKPMSSFFQMPQTGYGVLPGGRTGFREGMVHIPSAEEYVPPREFREEIMKSLKENFPEIYEPMIKEYYKKLTE